MLPQWLVKRFDDYRRPPSWPYVDYIGSSCQASTPSLTSVSVRAILFTAMGDDDVAVLVCDNGIGMIKAGFAGKDASCEVFPSILGRRKMPGGMVGGEQKICVCSLTYYRNCAELWR